MTTYVPEADELSGLSLAFFGEEACRPGHSWGPAIRDHHKIHFIVSGQGVFHCGGRTWQLGAGQGFLIVPGWVVRYEADHDHPWHYQWMGFRGPDADAVLARAGLSAESPVFACPLPDELNTALASFSAVPPGPGRSAALLGQFYGALSLILGSVPEASPSPKTGSYVQAAMEYIQANAFGSLSMADVARYVGLQRSYLGQLFRQTVGITPHEFLTRHRIREAQRLLDDPELSVGAVARSVGFDDPLHFSRVFRAGVGVSPRVWRDSDRRPHQTPHQPVSRERQP